ncbi:bifunctional glycosyltransferase/CDP-glycerol:glycerophosphate glycerophosphotransferase [Solicola gregarius]|uniref:Bifunctional glycosyltransferase family 2 protein/CDP-glycerol:glycerophosphate glycerophosphotransferase n=1 Tax=Solicola gregarius TaxID=2908642 RepID=A0AA46TGC9_9ACTN|nr:CDP-glycerol glycerophosphotransferase family protein [Solicola gregarius]UYM04854.1 bifunctional glycosyltransferase family 2 protein/CDP-glycerol:glycerophosphate glycerophosphotransferase [Solicola gregarius]
MPGRRAARRRIESPRRPVDPAVSVVVPIYNVEDYLRDCLDSILRQEYADFEVVVVDDGSPDGSAAIAAEYAERDARVRIIGRPNGGLGAARNTGIREASGRYLTFVDSDDELPPGALRRMVESAEESGSDMVVGSLRRFNSIERWKPRWVDDLHASAKTGITIDQQPGLVRNNYTVAKLYRRTFWDDAGLWFREGVAYEDQPLVTQLYVRARGIDVVKESVYRYRSRDDRSSISQQTATIADLRDRIAAWRVSHEEFSEHASPVVYRAWLVTLFDAHFHWYLRSPSVADDTYWRELQAAIADLTADAPPDLWMEVAPDRRVVLELARQDRRDDVVAFYERDGARPNAHPADPYTGGLRCRLPFGDDPELADWLFELSLPDVVLEHEIHAFRWVEGLTARIRGWSYVRQVDLAQHDSRTEVVLRHDPTGEEQAFATTRDDRPAYPPPVEHDRIDYGAGAFDCTFDLSDAAQTSLREGGRWDAFLRTTTGDLTVEIPIRRLVRSSSAGIVPAGVHAAGHRMIVDWRMGEPLSFVVDRYRVEATDVTLADGRLAGTLRGPDAAGVVTVELEDDAGQRVSVGEVGGAGAAERPFEIPLPPIDTAAMDPAEHVTWRVRAESADAGLVPVLYRGERQFVFGTSCAGVRALERTRNGLLATRAWRVVALADSVHVDHDGVLHVDGRLHGARTDQTTMRLRLRGRKTAVSSEPTAHADGSFSLSMPLEHEVWRFGRHVLPATAHDGSCILVDESGHEETVPLLLSQEVGSTLPIPVDTDRLEGRIIRGPQNRLRVHLGRPVRDARGRYRQHRLRNAPPGRQLRKSLLIRSYFGDSATCNGVGVLRELQRRGADLDVYWAVRDHSVPVPDGAHAVPMNSREWYDLLGSSAYYLDNMFQPAYHRKPDGQVLIQTFHGYPFKTMGHTHWKQTGRSAQQIDSYVRRAADWDHLVSPAAYASPLLRREFEYAGDVLEIGYPRNDVLLADDADSLRAVVRESLGIAPHQRAVLYAPTFRDYESPDDHRAALVDLLDIDAVASGLGDDGVLLVRGHAFNARAGEQVIGGPGVVDVTDYPEVSDLYLAADAAIVDYSSLRFDFAVTGKPMVFHVPDLARYQETRGWVVDFEPTAPGPRVDTTDEVIDQLRDLDRLREAYHDEYDRFRRDFIEREDGRAAARFVDAVMVPRGDAPSA